MELMKIRKDSIVLNELKNKIIGLIALNGQLNEIFYFYVV